MTAEVSTTSRSPAGMRSVRAMTSGPPCLTIGAQRLGPVGVVHVTKDSGVASEHRREPDRPVLDGDQEPRTDTRTDRGKSRFGNGQLGLRSESDDRAIQ
jgi:hypothetical protein